MGHKIGIIPAAGYAKRFGGIRKELLPGLNNKSFLWHCWERLSANVDDVYLVTSTENYMPQRRVMGGWVNYVLQMEGNDMWGAIWEVIRNVEADHYYFSMPDTMTPRYAFKDMPKAELALGVFETDDPLRFGTIRDDRIVNKSPGSRTHYDAWGVFTFSKLVRDLWVNNNPMDYTKALNDAIKFYGYKTWDLPFYYDFASTKDYFKYIRERTV